MNYSIYRFTLDIHRTKSQVSIPVLFRDTGIQFYISLTDGGKPYFIEDGCRAVFSAKKPDGATLFNDCIIEDNTRIRYDFTEQTTNCEGMMNCEIRLYGKDGNLLTTPAFVVVVDPRVVYDSEVLDSFPESTSLDNILSAENDRLVGEQQRVDAEAVRVIVENARAAAESERVAAENARLTAEVARGDAEAERIANEAERVAAYAHMIGSWVAYSAYEDGTDYTWTWSEGQRYIGICNGKTPPQDKTGFVWSKFVDTGIYVGSGEMPSWCDLQIDPNGDVTEIVQIPGQSTTNVMSQKAVSDNVANALKGNASGEILSLNDVSPIQHELGVKVRSKNILPTNYFSNPGKNAGDTFTYSDEEQKLTMRVDNSKNSTGVYKRVNTSIVEIGKRYAISVDLRGTAGKAMRFGLGGSTDLVSITLTEEYTRYTAYTTITSGDEPISLFVKSTENTGGFTEGDYFQWQNMQIALYEEGATATAYAPYIEDISAVTVSAQRKNLAHTNQVMNINASGITVTADINSSEITINGTATVDYAAKVMREIYLPAGTYTVSVFGLNEGERPDTLYINDLDTGKRISNYAQQGVPQSFTKEIAGNISVMCILKTGSTYTNANVAIQIEGGTGASDCEPYIEPVTYPVGADGVVQGVAAIYPNTTLTTDTAGAIIDCEYNRDANKVVGDIITRISALEAAVLN